MSHIRIKLVLTGPRKGKTCVLNGREFIDGICAMEGDIAALAGAVDYLGKCYAAFPEGSDEFVAAEAQYVIALAEKEASDGERDIQASPERDATADVQDPIRSDGGEPDAPPPDVEQSDDDSSAVDSGVQSGGDGQTDTRILPEPDAEHRAAIAQAVTLLDPANDAHWTSEGLPMVAAVTEAASCNVTRQEISIVVPDFNREMAQANQPEG